MANDRKFILLYPSRLKFSIRCHVCMVHAWQEPKDLGIWSGRGLWLMFDRIRHDPSRKLPRDYGPRSPRLVWKGGTYVVVCHCFSFWCSLEQTYSEFINKSYSRESNALRRRHGSLPAPQWARKSAGRRRTNRGSKRERGLHILCGLWYGVSVFFVVLIFTGTQNSPFALHIEDKGLCVTLYRTFTSPGQH